MEPTEGDTSILSLFECITTRIVEACAEAGRPCSDRVAAYTLRAVTLDSSNDYNFECLLTSTQMTNLINTATHRVLDNDNPSSETIKMQAAFDGISLFVEQQLSNATTHSNNATKQRIDDIIEFSSRVKTDTQITKLYKLVFELLLLNAAVDQINDGVEREIAAALQSAFPKSRVKEFSQMSRERKREQIYALINIILGIRVFNRSIGKGGEGLDDTPTKVTEICNGILQHVQHDIDTISKASEKYTEVIRIEFALPGTVTSSLPRLQDELRNRQQLFAFLSQLHNELSEAQQLISSATSLVRKEIDELSSLVGTRVSVPKGQVFPKFDAIGKLWRALDAELKQCQSKNDIFLQLQKFRDNFTVTLNDNDVELTHDKSIASLVNAKEAQDANMNSFASEVDDSKGPARLHEAKLLKSDDTDNFHELELEYEGYCAWTIVQRDALLLPGDTSLGVVRYRNKYYALIDETAIDAFIASPVKYLDGVQRKVRSAPELIHLLHMQSQFHNVNVLQEKQHDVVVAYGEPSTTHEVATETPTHFNEQSIDLNYTWNEWELRRRALKIVRLRQARTHASQTNESHFKRDAETQVTIKARVGDDDVFGQGTQTGIDCATNTIVRKRFIGGLRGSPKTRATFLTLEIQ